MPFRNDGYCTWCESGTTFVAHGDWLRDQYICERCGSIPRQRALLAVLNMIRPNWQELAIHESSPADGRVPKRCRNYSSSYFFEGVEPGSLHRGHRCENIESMTFEGRRFDVFITQDVLEHVFEPALALREIERVLSEDGLHIFTTPVHKSLSRSQRRAKLTEGHVEHLLPAEYHGNPISNEGSLVTWDYGNDIDSLLAEWSGYQCSRFILRDRSLGLDGDYLDVFVIAKNELNGNKALCLQ